MDSAHLAGPSGDLRGKCWGYVEHMETDRDAVSSLEAVHSLLKEYTRVTDLNETMSWRRLHGTSVAEP